MATIEKRKGKKGTTYRATVRRSGYPLLQRYPAQRIALDIGPLSLRNAWAIHERVACVQNVPLNEVPAAKAATLQCLPQPATAHATVNASLPDQNRVPQVQ